MFDGVLPETNWDSGNLVRLRATGMRSPIARSARGGYPVRCVQLALPAHGTRPAIATMWSAATPSDGAAGGSNHTSAAVCDCSCRLYGPTLVVTKLDRLARNVAFISKLMESGIDFVAADFPQASRLTVHILAAVAEHAATMISQRTRAALAAAKVCGDDACHR
jgi:hypothetical protein